MGYKYNVLTGIEHAKTHTKRLMFGGLAALTVMAGASGAAFAASNGPQASPCGAGHGAFANVNGNFGFLGAEGGTPGYHDDAVGQDPGATGYNNSNTGCQQL